MHGMNYIGRVLSNFKDFYNDINAATLTGAIDVIVVEQPDGTYNCSPFHVRFGKLGVLRSREKLVDIEINGEPQKIHMKLGESGEAFFVEELEDSDDNEIPEHLATSPIPVSEFQNMLKTQGRRRSFDLGQDHTPGENQVNDYTKRRNTAENENSKTREHNFIKRQIKLGNIEVGENSAEDLTLSIHSNHKMSCEDISRDNNISETIFKMDSLDVDYKKTEPQAQEKIENVVTTPVRGNDSIPESRNSKRKRRKTKKKNAPRKSSSSNQLPSNTNSEVPEKASESATERSSLDSNSDPDLKEMQKFEETPVPSTNRKVLDPEFHFFSDTELTTGNVDSRGNTPAHLESVQSDSEFEVKNRKEETTGNGQSWEWGGFPQNQVLDSEHGTSKQDEKMSMISGMFSFMRTNHGTPLRPEGIYLSDLSSGNINPEIAAIYFTKMDEKHTDGDMDCESGNGPSLTQSPNSVEGCKSIDSDFDEQNKVAQTYIHDISISLCGWEPEPSLEKFTEHAISFSDLCNNPLLFENSSVVVRIRDKYYNWRVAAPLIASLLIYNRPLPQSSLDQLCSIHMPSTNLQEKNENKQENKQYSWWSWRRGRSSREATPAGTSESISEPKGVETKDEHVTIGMMDQRVDLPNADIKGKIDISLQSSSNEDMGSQSPKLTLSDKYRKTLRLSSKLIAELNLIDGVNDVEFSVTTAYQGTTRCKCHLYKWKWDDKIVISDIDGTITKSDVLGHILPIVGRDWAQSGVAQLFNKISDNGYKLLYLSARAIGQAKTTREYLRSIKQEDLTMPDGPVLLNPTSLISAFHREVIEKKPEQFKISCMSDIKALFPIDSNPFYAGYGNRINDVWAYTAVGIPIVRIFTINPKGELKHELTQTFQSSYSNMSYIVDQLFPSRGEAANDYSQFAYWRDPICAAEELPELA